MKTPELLSSSQISAIEKTIGYTFERKKYLAQAFTRSSYRNEHPECPDNEVLELIGDSVLSLTVLTDASDLLLARTEAGITSEWNEGKMSSLKNALVNKHHLASCMRPLNLAKHLLVSEGDRKVGVMEEDSVLEDLTESILGAVYVDSGWNFVTAAKVARRLLNLSKELEAVSDRKVHLSYRNDLQEWAQNPTRRLGVPKFDITETPDGFRAVVSIQKLGVSTDGYGKNQKAASEDAAKKMLALLTSPQVRKKVAKEEKTLQQEEGSTPNYIGILNERLQKMGEPVAAYTVLKESILPGNLHHFEVRCDCLGKSTVGIGESKQSARHAAAKEMLEK